MGLLVHELPWAGRGPSKVCEIGNSGSRCADLETTFGKESCVRVRLARRHPYCAHWARVRTGGYMHNRSQYEWTRDTPDIMRRTVRSAQA